MTLERHTHRLTGCTPTPLASYLKALGILRLVSEQSDAAAQAWWSGNVFHLKTTLDRRVLCSFLTCDYSPTPIVAPWNGGSGFYAKDSTKAITAISGGAAVRTSRYRRTIDVCRVVLASLGHAERPTGGEKERLLVACRAALPDEAVAWLDAAFVLTNDGPKYPPLLGTGGNDGRLEFTNNLMQRLLDLFDPDSGEPTTMAHRWLEEALFLQVQDGLQTDSILGQFDPGAIERPVNPWDYVLMIEGAIVFAAAAAKRHETGTRGTLSYPFCVRPAGVGYGSAASSDEDSCRAELWLPLWSRPCSRQEAEALFSEGRAELPNRRAKNGVDFARAVSTLGTDRGIEQFVRLGFHARNGLAYFAVPLGLFPVRRQPQVDLLSPIDQWLDNFRRAATSDNAPSSGQRALRLLECAILDLCQQGAPVRLQAVVVALGMAESTLARSAKWRAASFMPPVPLLASRWLIECDDGSPEFRLAASLAGIASTTVGGLRQHIEPVEIKGGSGAGQQRWASWTESSAAARDVGWNDGDLEDNLIGVLTRRAVQAVRLGERWREGTTLAFPGNSVCFASLADVAAFLARRTDDERIAAIARGLVLLDWQAVDRRTVAKLRAGLHEPTPDSIYALLKLCHSQFPVDGVAVPFEPRISRLAAAGRIESAMQVAARRLRGSRLVPAIEVASRSRGGARRLAASLLFPLDEQSTRHLADLALIRELKTI